MSYNKIEILFSKFFSNKILENEIVSTIVYIISKYLVVLKTKIDNTLNNDI